MARINEIKTTGRAITIKCEPKYFSPMDIGRKSFELCLNDKNYLPGDILIIQCIPEGAKAVVFVDYVLKGGKYGLDPDYVTLSITLLGLECRLAKCKVKRLK